jgi:hypothetical protein
MRRIKMEVAELGIREEQLSNEITVMTGPHGPPH